MSRLKALWLFAASSRHESRSTWTRNVTLWISKDIKDLLLMIISKISARYWQTDAWKDSFSLILCIWLCALFTVADGLLETCTSHKATHYEVWRCHLCCCDEGTCSSKIVLDCSREPLWSPRWKETWAHKLQIIPKNAQPFLIWLLLHVCLRSSVCSLFGRCLDNIFSTSQKDKHIFELQIFWTFEAFKPHFLSTLKILWLLKESSQ